METKTWKWERRRLSFKLVQYKPKTIRENVKCFVGRLIEMGWNRFLPIILVLLFVMTTNILLFVPLLLNIFVDVKVDHETPKVLGVQR